MATTFVKCEKPCRHNIKGFCSCWLARWYWETERKPIKDEAQVKAGDVCEWEEEINS